MLDGLIYGLSFTLREQVANARLCSSVHRPGRRCVRSLTADWPLVTVGAVDSGCRSAAMVLPATPQDSDEEMTTKGLSCMRFSQLITQLAEEHSQAQARVASLSQEVLTLRARLKSAEKFVVLNDCGSLKEDNTSRPLVSIASRAGQVASPMGDALEPTVSAASDDDMEAKPQASRREQSSFSGRLAKIDKPEAEDMMNSSADDNSSAGTPVAGTPRGSFSFSKQVSMQTKRSQDCSDFKLKDTWTKAVKGAHMMGPLERTLTWSPSGEDKRRPGHRTKRGFKSVSFEILGHELGNFRLAWDACGGILIGYDLLVIPFSQAFKPDPTPVSQVIDMIALVFWTLDMLQAPFLGFYAKGKYIDRHKLILLNYLRTWFIVDLIVVGPEWLTIILGSGGDMFGGLGRMLKSARAVRVLRLLRLLKLQRLMNSLYDMLESEYAFTIVNLAKLLVFVALLNHVIACLWYLTGRLNNESGIRNWTQIGDVGKEDTLYVYTTALHWSLTQFTPASMEISARNTTERIFSIIVLFFAMVAFSSIVASITGTMTSLRNLKGDDMKQFWLLRRYLRQRNVSPELAARIFRFLEYQSESQTSMVQASSLKVLTGLSEELMIELTHSMFAPFVVGHPFFSLLNGQMETIMFRLCGTCLKTLVAAEGDVLFNSGDEARRMYFIKNGRSRYLRMCPDMEEPEEIEPAPQVKEWVGEATLWTDWRHRGNFAASTALDLIVLTPQQFSDVMSRHLRPWTFAKQYGKLYIRYMNDNIDSVYDLLRSEEFYEGAIHDIASAALAGQTEDGDGRRMSTRSVTSLN
eukprot:TRINITY_DN41281_c0_g1_i2.p1 TRINITY_DN41281_c0_g1~~TRINITY_DN41281_c0_g1_i2.p1  ORF type:complete len:805 (-),score=152.68 TRINITY_DN41281_c0_g1_i2:249-2663(-)